MLNQIIIHKSIIINLKCTTIWTCKMYMGKGAAMAKKQAKDKKS